MTDSTRTVPAAPLHDPVVITQSLRPSLSTVAPLLFVVLWSTGFIGAKFGLPFAEPFTFLFIRMVLACALLLLVTRITRSTFPRHLVDYSHISVSGLLIHAGYLGGVFFAIDHGMPAGLSSLIVGLQPILTAVLAQAMLREKVTSRQWAGLLLGFLGVALVVEEKISAALEQPIKRVAFAGVAIGLVSTTVGTLYQKRYVRTVDLAAGATIQYAASAVVLGLLAFQFETMEIDWTPNFIFALSWLVLVLSFGAILLLLKLIREHSVSRISSLLYLVPPLTAIEAYFIFGENFGLVALFGMALVVLGVALVIRRPA